MKLDELIAIIDVRGGVCSERRFDAVEQLIAMGSPAKAAPAIVRLFARTPSDFNAHDQLAKQLPSFGPSIVEPLLRALEVGLDRDTLYLGNTCQALARLDVRDDRIFLRIKELYVHHDFVWGAQLFGVYGDPKAIPILAKAIASMEPKPDYADYLDEINTVVEAHARCGGVLDDATAKRLSSRKAAWSRARFSVVRSSRSV